MYLLNVIKEMYVSQNHFACIFQFKRDIASLQQDGKPFIQHNGSMKNMENELHVYEPHTIDAASY